MITINLLPEDLKRAPRRNDGRRTAVLAVMLLAAVAGGLGYFHVAYVGARGSLNRDLAARVASLKKHTEELATLEAAIKHVEKRKRALSALHEDRILWSEKLDQLVDIVPPNVWFKSIRLTGAQRNRREGGRGTLTFECYSAGSEEKGITLFRERLKEHQAFWQDISTPSPISHVKVEFPEYIEREALQFTMSLGIKARAPAVPPGRATDARRTRTAAAGAPK